MADVMLVGGDLPVKTQYVTGFALIMQRVRVRLGLHQGEDIHDQRKGIPFLEWRREKVIDVNNRAAYVKAEIESVTGVLRVENWNATHDANARCVRMTGDVYMQDEDGNQSVTTVTVQDALLAHSNGANPAAVVFTSSRAIFGGV